MPREESQTLLNYTALQPVVSLIIERALELLKFDVVNVIIVSPARKLPYLCAAILDGKANMCGRRNFFILKSMEFPRECKTSALWTLLRHSLHNRQSVSLAS
jgi:hypothetical protein